MFICRNLHWGDGIFAVWGEIPNLRHTACSRHSGNLIWWPVPQHKEGGALGDDKNESQEIEIHNEYLHCDVPSWMWGIPTA
mmetsp:Transcript_21197/g.48924  ORF Transcript_21197/g.48924 Transcript_21197/m.48924 type:complete len:81 (-) Transcript_21197:1493-1735(-)